MDSNLDVLDANINDNSYKPEIELIDSGKFIILFFLTFGLYGIWWMYKSWNFFKEKDKLDIMPAARALFAIFFMYSLFENIKDFAKSNGYQKNYSSVALFIGFIALNLLSRLPEPFFLISVMGFLFLLHPFNALNFAIEKSGMYNVKNGPFNGKQITLIVIGSIIWILLVLGLMA